MTEKIMKLEVINKKSDLFSMNQTYIMRVGA